MRGGAVPVSVQAPGRSHRLACWSVQLIPARRTHARDLPHHAAAELAIDSRTPIHRCAVKIAVRVERRCAVGHVTVAAIEVVKIDHDTGLAAIGQLEYRA